MAELPSFAVKQSFYKIGWSGGTDLRLRMIESTCLIFLLYIVAGLSV